MRGLLSGWYPGFGEVEAIKKMPAPVRKFLADAVARDPSFASEYIIPRLSQPNAYSMIVSDILSALDVPGDKPVNKYLGVVNPQWISNLCGEELDKAAASRGVASLGSLGMGVNPAFTAVQAALQAGVKNPAALMAAAQAATAKAAAQKAALLALTPAQQQAMRLGIPGFMDQLRSLTNDPAIIAQGQAIEQRVMNGQSAGRDTETVPAKADAAALIAKLQADAKAAKAAAIAAQHLTPEQQVAASQAAIQQSYQAPTKVTPAAAAAAAAATAATVASDAASKAAMQATADARTAELVKQQRADIIARIGRGEQVARSEYAMVYSEIKPGGQHPYVDWTAYEAANGRVHSSWLSKIATPFLTVVGAVLAPFTGGASLAAASVISGVIKATQAAGQATVARNAAAYNAPQQTAAAQQQQSAAQTQLDQFFAANQPWFTQHGITQAAWNAMTTDQKIAILNAGVTGQPVQNTSSGGSSQPSSYGGSGGGGSGGTYPDGSSSSGGFSPYGAQPGAAPGAPVATAGMFGGSTLPILAVGAALALMFGKPVKGGRKTRRNPSRRSRRYRWSA